MLGPLGLPLCPAALFAKVYSSSMFRLGFRVQGLVPLEQRNWPSKPYIMHGPDLNRFINEELQGFAVEWLEL